MFLEWLYIAKQWKYGIEIVDGIEAKWSLLVSVNLDTTGSDNVFSPVWWQAIIWTNVDFTGNRNKPLSILIQNITIFIQEK